MNTAKKELTDKLIACITACNHCFDACLGEEHVAHMVDCIRTDRECADVCTFTLSMITREGTVQPDLLNLCARTCQACGDECAKHDHEHCQACAKACYECVEACRNYSLES